MKPNDHYRGRTAPLNSKCCILYIYSKNVGTEYFKHGIYSPFLFLQNAVYFTILTYLVPVLFTFYIPIYIYSTNIGTEYFKHGIYSPTFSLQNSFCFTILTYLVPVLFTFYIHIYIYSTNIGTEYFKHGRYSPIFSLQNAVCFTILTYLVPALFTFYIQDVLKLKKNNSRAKRLTKHAECLRILEVV